MARISDEQLKQLVEAAIFVADGPLSKDKLQNTVLDGLGVSTQKLNKALEALELDYRPRGIRLVQVASGYRFQSDDSLSPWLSKLWQESAPRYSRALLETLALIAYRQPVTRGEIEDVRGVTVSSNIIKTLTERDWVKVVGHREVPGRPALYATTKGFLDYFGLQSLEQLPDIEGFDDEIEDLFSMPTDDDAQRMSAGDNADRGVEQSEEASLSPDNVIPLRGAEKED